MFSVGVPVFGGTSVGPLVGTLVAIFRVGTSDETLGLGVLAEGGEVIDDGRAVSELLLGINV